MKKILSVLLVLSMLLFASAALAEDLGIQVIGGPDTESIPMSLDDMQLGQEYTIDGYAKIEPVEYLEIDFFAQFKQDANYTSVSGNASGSADHVFVDKANTDFYSKWRWWDAGWQESGMNADFAWLLMDVTNLQKKDYDFMQNVTVKVIYQDEYEFAGWVRQVNYDYLNYGENGREVTRMGYDNKIPNVVVLDPANVEEIGMMYTGTYAFGATLPNNVFEDTQSSLQMIVTIDGNELTYNIRK